MLVDLDNFNQDELLCLRDDIERFLRAYDASEAAYSDGCEDWEEIEVLAQKAAAKLRDRIKGFAIELGIQGDFLREYSELGKKYQLQG